MGMVEYCLIWTPGVAGFVMLGAAFVYYEVIKKEHDVQ